MQEYAQLESTNAFIFVPKSKKYKNVQCLCGFYVVDRG